MRWKLLLAAVLIAGIVALLFWKFGPRQIISSMASLLNLFSQPQTGGQFKIEFIAHANAFVGQKYEVTFSSAGISIPKLTLENVDGEIKRFKANQWFSQSLNRGSIEIENFVGEVKIDPNTTTITFTGYASRVKGTNFEGSIFEWVG
jgi:hypothetical protein